MHLKTALKYHIRVHKYFSKIEKNNIPNKRNQNLVYNECHYHLVCCYFYNYENINTMIIREFVATFSRLKLSFIEFSRSVRCRFLSFA